jgi:hypothetical protein
MPLSLPPVARRPPSFIAGWHGTYADEGYSCDETVPHSIARHGFWPGGGLFGDAVYVALHPEVARRYARGAYIKVTVEVPSPDAIEWFVFGGGGPEWDWNGGRPTDRPIAAIIDNDRRGETPRGGWHGGSQLAVYDPELVKVDAIVQPGQLYQEIY